MRAGPFVPAVVWMGVIFWLSTPSFAAEETGGWILPLLKALLPWATLPQLEFIHWLGRKMAHVTEYAILAWLWHRALSRPGRGPRSLAAFALTVAYAITDELHQGWTGRRGGSVPDVGPGAASRGKAWSSLPPSSWPSSSRSSSSISTEPSRGRHGATSRLGNGQSPRAAAGAVAERPPGDRPGRRPAGGLRGRGGMAARPRRHRALRDRDPADHHRLGRAPGAPEHRDGALHALRGRADLHGVHADRPGPGVLGMGLRVAPLPSDRLARLGPGRGHGRERPLPGPAP